MPNVTKPLENILMKVYLADQYSEEKRNLSMAEAVNEIQGLIAELATDNKGLFASHQNLHRFIYKVNTEL